MRGNRHLRKQPARQSGATAGGGCAGVAPSKRGMTRYENC